MPLAELHGKLSAEVRRSEDALTGSAFNLLTLLPPDRCLLPWLNLAEDLAGTRIGLPARAEVAAAFWPQWKDGSGRDCEPDVVLSVQAGGTTVAVLIEVKYLSGLSGWPTSPHVSEMTGQLGREWQALQVVRDHELPGSPATTSRRVIVYVTTDAQRPTATLEASIQELAVKTDAAGANIFWLSWFTLSSVIESVGRESDLPVVERLALERLFALLASRRLVVFSGINPPVPVQIPWSYESGYLGTIQPVVIPWSYSS